MSALSTQDIFDSIPPKLSGAMLEQMATAMQIGGFGEAALKGLGVHIGQFITEVRGTSQGPLTADQKCELQIKVWEWCIHTAREGRAR